MQRILHILSPFLRLRYPMGIGDINVVPSERSDVGIRGGRVAPAPARSYVAYGSMSTSPYDLKPVAVNILMR